MPTACPRSCLKPTKWGDQILEIGKSSPKICSASRYNPFSIEENKGRFLFVVFSHTGLPICSKMEAFPSFSVPGEN